MILLARLPWGKLKVTHLMTRIIFIFVLICQKGLKLCMAQLMSWLFRNKVLLKSFTCAQTWPLLLYTHSKKPSQNKIKLQTLCKKLINTLYAYRNSGTLTNSHIIKGDKPILGLKTWVRLFANLYDYISWRSCLWSEAL